MQHVARVPRITLANLNRGEASRRSALVVPHAKNVRQAAGFQRVPDLRRASDAFEQTSFVHRFVLRGAGENRVVTVHDRLDV